MQARLVPGEKYLTIPLTNEINCVIVRRIVAGRQENMTQYGIVLVTAGSRSEAEAIASSLVEIKLAACVSITPIHSVYSWEGKIESEEEWQLTIKTDLSQFAALEAQVRQLHSYEVPEIIALPIATASQAYLEWISENTQR